MKGFGCLAAPRIASSVGGFDPSVANLTSKRCKIETKKRKNSFKAKVRPGQSRLPEKPKIFNGEITTKMKILTNGKDDVLVN